MSTVTEEAAAPKSSPVRAIIGPAVANIPWEPKPADDSMPVWRYSRNPIVKRDQTLASNSIFNSAVVPFGHGFVGVFRVDDTCGISNLHTAWSDDGINWRIEEDTIQFVNNISDLPFEYGYDPRVTKLDGRYYVTWCNGIKWDPTIGCAWTEDFRKYHLMENLTLPHNRNGVLFPRRIDGMYALLSRPSDPGHTAFGSIYYSQSPDLRYWGDHRFVMGTAGGWQRTKVGAGPTPLETREGWLLLYHGVKTTVNGMIYSMGAALLDLEQPWKVRYRTEPYLLNPRELYECVGDVPNVCFPVGLLADSVTGRLAIYYGGADTVIALAFAQVDELLAYIMKHSTV